MKTAFISIAAGVIAEDLLQAIHDNQKDEGVVGEYMYDTGEYVVVGDAKKDLERVWVKLASANPKVAASVLWARWSDNADDATVVVSADPIKDPEGAMGV